MVKNYWIIITSNQDFINDTEVQTAQDDWRSEPNPMPIIKRYQVTYTPLQDRISKPCIFLPFSQISTRRTYRNNFISSLYIFSCCYNLKNLVEIFLDINNMFHRHCKFIIQLSKFTRCLREL